MKTSALLLAAAVSCLLTAPPAVRAVDTDPGYGPGSQAQLRNGSGVAAASLYRPTKRYFTKNGAILYDFVPASRTASRNVALGRDPWMFSKVQQWRLEQGMSPRIVLTTLPVSAPKPPPIAEGPQPQR